jgi:hypothetical protein
MLVIRRVMRRYREGESRMVAAMLAGRESLTLYHGHLVLVLMGSVVHHVVNSGFGAEIARFELLHYFLLRLGRPQGAVGCGYFIRKLAPRWRGQQQQ